MPYGAFVTSGKPFQRSSSLNGDRRVVRVSADRPRLHELLHAGATGVLDEVKPHRHIGEEEPPGVVAVGADPADLRRQVHDDGRLDVLVEPLDLGLAGNVVILAAEGDDVGEAALLQLVEDEAAKEAGAAGDEDSVRFSPGSSHDLRFRPQTVGDGRGAVKAGRNAPGRAAGALLLHGGVRIVDEREMIDVTPTNEALLCPACGYDLRGAPGDRCSECGLVLDRSTLDHSGFPWAYRQVRGRVRAFLQTVWLVTLDAKALRFENARRQSPADAGSFRRWVGALVVAVALALVGFVYAFGGVYELIVHKPSPFAAAPLAGGAQDLLVPWSAGIGLPGALFVYGAMLAACLVAAPGTIFRPGDLPARQADAVTALGRYVAAPLAWLLPAAIVFAAAVVAERWEEDGRFARTPAFMVMVGTYSLLAIVAVGATVHRTGQWRARTRHAGYPAGFAAMGELLLRWVVAIAVAAFLVPWCVGFVWIVVDSFLG
jgi:hypothetical protein